MHWLSNYSAHGTYKTSMTCALQDGIEGHIDPAHNVAWQLSILCFMMLRAVLSETVSIQDKYTETTAVTSSELV